MAVARARAVHQSADEPRVFTDPFAARIVGAEAMRANEFDQGLDPAVVRERRLLIAARSRLADDVIAAALDRGIRQVVILGAGLDTSAYRNTRADVRYFEVDHPETQEWKRKRLTETGIEIPETLTFAPVDFEKSTLADGLADAGLDRARGALFVWLGVLMYLTGPSVDKTLRYIAEQGQTAEVVFDYRYPAEATTGVPEHELRARANRVASAGEPWLSYHTAEEIRAILRPLGFTEIQDRSAPELLTAYGVETGARSTTSGSHFVHARL